jgi:hypothetical protein
VKYPEVILELLKSTASILLAYQAGSLPAKGDQGLSYFEYRQTQRLSW